MCSIFLRNGFFDRKRKIIFPLLLPVRTIYTWISFPLPGMPKNNVGWRTNDSCVVPSRRFVAGGSTDSLGRGDGQSVLVCARVVGRPSGCPTPSLYALRSVIAVLHPSIQSLSPNIPHLLPT
jgi:hypothetical protein